MCCPPGVLRDHASHNILEGLVLCSEPLEGILYDGGLPQGDLGMCEWSSLLQHLLNRLHQGQKSEAKKPQAHTPVRGLPRTHSASTQDTTLFVIRPQLRGRVAPRRGKAARRSARVHWHPHIHASQLAQVGGTTRKKQLSLVVANVQPHTRASSPTRQVPGSSSAQPAHSDPGYHFHGGAAGRCAGRGTHLLDDQLHLFLVERALHTRKHRVSIVCHSPRCSTRPG